MGKKLCDGSLRCARCGLDLSFDSLWLDDSGILCRDCVMTGGYPFVRRRGDAAPARETRKRGRETHAGEHTR